MGVGVMVNSGVGEIVAGSGAIGMLLGDEEGSRTVGLAGTAGG